MRSSFGELRGHLIRERARTSDSGKYPRPTAGLIADHDGRIFLLRFSRRDGRRGKGENIRKRLM